MDKDFDNIIREIKDNRRKLIEIVNSKTFKPYIEIYKEYLKLDKFEINDLNFQSYLKIIKKY